MSTQTQANKLSIPNHWTQSLQLSMSKPDTILSTRLLKQGKNYSLTVINAESIPTKEYLEIYVTG